MKTRQSLSLYTKRMWGGIYETRLNFKAALKTKKRKKNPDQSKHVQGVTPTHSSVCLTKNMMQRASRNHGNHNLPPQAAAQVGQEQRKEEPSCQVLPPYTAEPSGSISGNRTSRSSSRSIKPLLSMKTWPFGACPEQILC